MGERQPHRWLIEWSELSLKTLKRLSPKDRMAVFHSVEHLAKAKNPYNVPGVKKLKDPQLERMRRVRAGDYRIIFWLDSGEVVQLEFSYKGKLMIDGIYIHHTGY